jgi:diguanylate cyclase (GGDEF)-like protein/PAS domain S-box-containing protein
MSSDDISCPSWDSNLAATVAAKRFAELFRSLPVACLGIDADGTIFEWNDRATTLFGISASDAMGRNAAEMIAQSYSRDGFGELMMRAMNESAVVQESMDWIGAGGAVLNSQTSLIALHAGIGQDVTGVLCAIVDVTRERTLAATLGAKIEELDRLSEELEHASRTDMLTGLLNTRAFRERLNREVRAARLAEPLSLAMLDVDHFKKFNDTFGHQAGDEVLAIVGEVLRGLGRATDVPARYGGEEFAVIMPATDESTAMQVAEDLRAALEAWPCPYRTITASFGVAELCDDMKDGSALVRGADEALYASKHAGRNRVTCASTIPRSVPVFDEVEWIRRNEQIAMDPFASADEQLVQRLLASLYLWTNRIRAVMGGREDRDEDSLFSFHRSKLAAWLASEEARGVDDKLTRALRERAEKACLAAAKACEQPRPDGSVAALDLACGRVAMVIAAIGERLRESQREAA